MMKNRNNERDWERLVDTMKNQHNRPPETPRDRMWERIDAARAPRRNRVVEPDFQRRWSTRSWGLVGAAAAVLVLGIAIGRWTGTGGGLTAPTAVSVPQEQPPVLATTAPGGGDLLYRKAAADLFGRADALLTNFKVTACADQDLASVPDWAGGMLLQTRLLMNTPVARDQEMRSLLLDLELVLAQIVGLSKDNCQRDVAWIRDGMDQKSTLDRLRQARPGTVTGEPL